MPVQKLEITNIQLGDLVSTANDALDEVAKDVIARPYNKNPRKVTITIIVKPEMTSVEGKNINQPGIDWSVARTLPGNKGLTTRAFIEDQNLVINPGLPSGGTPNQTTIFDVAKDSSASGG